MCCDVLWCGVVWCGVMWCGTVWCGVLCCAVLWCGVVWCGVVWCGVVWCGVVWCGVVWCGVVWCGMVWCGVVWCGVTRSQIRDSGADPAKDPTGGYAARQQKSLEVPAFDTPRAQRMGAFIDFINEDSPAPPRPAKALVTSSAALSQTQPQIHALPHIR